MSQKQNLTQVDKTYTGFKRQEQKLRYAIDHLHVCQILLQHFKTV